jgi:hypothetical protein
MFGRTNRTLAVIAMVRDCKSLVRGASQPRAPGTGARIGWEIALNTGLRVSEMYGLTLKGSVSVVLLLQLTPELSTVANEQVQAGLAHVQ